MEKVLKAFRMQDCSAVSTPMEAGAAVYMVPSTDPPDDVRTQEYQSIVGSGMYAMTQTRPDLAYTLSVLSRFNQNPSLQYIKAAKRMLRYIQGTKLLGITYTGHPSGTLDIQVYSDSDYTGDLETRRSTTGYTIYIAGSPTIWKSNRQKAVTLSSIEAEYYALLSVTKEAAWI